MTTLSPIEPDTGFHDLEGLICDAVSMTDVLTNSIRHHFENVAPSDGFVINAEDADRLFFLASMVTSMSDKVREAFYVALRNEREAKEMRRSSR